MKRGVKPKGKVEIKWSSNFAYALGLLATDGCLYSDGLHICFTSKDLEQVNNFKEALGIDSKIGIKSSGSNKIKKYYTVQFGDVLFYKFLVSIGIGPAKSKTIGSVKIPDKYFFDFLRGCFDGDGTVYSYWDKRWKSSFMFYLEFASASKKHIFWLREEINKRLLVSGHITNDYEGSTLQLKYAKKESLKIFRKMYYSDKAMCLQRKKLKIIKILDIVGEDL